MEGGGRKSGAMVFHLRHHIICLGLDAKFYSQNNGVSLYVLNLSILKNRNQLFLTIYSFTFSIVRYNENHG